MFCTRCQTISIPDTVDEVLAYIDAGDGVLNYEADYFTEHYEPLLGRFVARQNW
jgi:hypothetical protein